MDINDKVIELSGISCNNSAGRPIFSDLDFSLGAGQTAIITGSTGTGKTTLVELVVGTRKPLSGSVTVFGCTLNPGRKKVLNNIRKRIGGVGGIFRPISYYTVYENMKYPLILRGVRLSRQKAIVMKALAQISLFNKKNEKVSDLSRGEKILLMIGRAVVANQPLLIIDEPMAGLDPAMSDAVLNILKRLSIAGHSMLILTSGQTGLEIPGALKYSIANGRIL